MNFCRCEFSGCAVFAPCSSVTAFGHFVRDIVKVRSKKQVARILASWIVAIMQHMKAQRNRSVLKYPCKAMGIALHIIPLETAIAFAVSRSGPRPAFVWSLDVDLCPIAFHGVFFMTRHIHAFSPVANFAPLALGYSRLAPSSDTSEDAIAENPQPAFAESCAACAKPLVHHQIQTLTP